MEVTNLWFYGPKVFFFDEEQKRGKKKEQVKEVDLCGLNSFFAFLFYTRMKKVIIDNIEEQKKANID